MPITQLPPLSLYIHTPWCVQKCPYCDFNSHQVKQKIPEKAYIDRLLFDLEQELPAVWGRQLYSIFIGGGTPSLFSAQSIDRLLCGIRALLPFPSEMEVTLEANPGTVEAGKFKGFFDAGVNRISIGVQSFDNAFLSKLGRIHTADEALSAFSIARDAGFNNINLDLMYALPGQTIEQAMQDLKIALALEPEHLSWYQLTLEPNTLFYHRPPSLPDDDLVLDISDKGIDLLVKNNYPRYEISAFSQDGKYPSQHNLNYWQFGDYLGIGAGAHQKITRADTQTITRKTKRRHPKDYLNRDQSPTDSSCVIAPQELPLEFMMNAFRLKNGVDRDLFFNTTGLFLSQIEPSLKKAMQQNFLKNDRNKLCPTAHGYQFLNELLALFMPENFSALTSKNSIAVKTID